MSRSIFGNNFNQGQPRRPQQQGGLGLFNNRPAGPAQMPMRQAQQHPQMPMRQAQQHPQMPMRQAQQHPQMPPMRQAQQQQAPPGPRGHTQPPQQRQRALPQLNPNLQNPFEAKLPDGIQIVPLNENNMQNLGSIGLQQPQQSVPPTQPLPMHQAPPPMPAMQLPPPAPPMPATQQPPPPQEQATHNSAPPAQYFQSFIQNERNANVFYQNLAKTTQNEEHKTHLQRISANCAAYQAKLSAMHQAHTGEAFAPRQAEIGSPASLQAGLRLAIAQEASNAAEAAKLYETNETPELLHQLSSYLHQKTLDIAMLTLMLA